VVDDARSKPHPIEKKIDGVCGPRNAAYYREAARRVLRLQAKYLIIGAKEAR
jgi:hypothetical protein